MEGINCMGIQRAIASALISLTVAVGLSPLVYRLQFGRFPPSRVNLALWISPAEGCLERGLHAERAPLLGTDVGIADICPDSEFGPSSADGVLVGPFPWLVVLMVPPLVMAWLIVRGDRAARAAGEP